MVTVKALNDRFKSLSVAAIASQAVNATKDILIAQNNLQLYDGKMRDGQDIHPNYLEDPFFKTQAQAIGYAKWKQRITPNPNRGIYTPNLYINGFYHSTRTVTITEDKIIYDSDAPFSGSIEEKYGPNINGLGGKYKRLYIKVDLFPALLKIAKENTGL